MSQMPSKIWLHKNTKYSTGDIVCGYQYDFVQGIEDEGGIENFVEYVLTDAFIEKLKCWLNENGRKYYGEFDEGFLIGFRTSDEAIDDFRKYMKGE